MTGSKSETGMSQTPQRGSGKWELNFTSCN